MKADSVKETLKEYGRGLAGGLIFSIPLLYTMEVWWRGFTAEPHYHLILVVVTYLLLLGYNTFAGIRENTTFKGVFWDSVEELTLGFLVSTGFLFLIGKISLEMAPYEMIGKIIVESMVVAIGISVGTKQLGQENKGGEEKKSKKNKMDSHPVLLKVFILGVCGSVLFSSSVAPTMEILKIAVESEGIHLIFMVLISLILSTMIMFFIDFIKTGKRQNGLTICVHVLVCYSAALATSAFLLWYFGRFGERSLSIIVAQIIVLSIPGALGASAGRLVIGK